MKKKINGFIKCLWYRWARLWWFSCPFGSTPEGRAVSLIQIWSFETVRRVPIIRLRLAHMAWRQRIVSLVCFANNAIHPWPRVMLIFDREMPPGFTPAICLRCNFVYISNLERVGETNPSTKTSKILFWIVMSTFGKSCRRPCLHGLKNQRCVVRGIAL